jgi:Mg2+/Co2+ transporter CorB
MLDRVIALLVVIVAAVVPFDVLAFIKSEVVQFVLACIVVLWMIFMDVYAGLLLGVALLIAYFRMNSQHILSWSWNWGRNKGPMATLVQDYITPENLHDAQNNVVSISDYSTEMKGIDGVYGEPVYGAQGMDKVMPGWTKETSLMGDVFITG